MRKLIFLIFLFPVCTWATPSGVSQPPVFNPFTGSLDYVGPGNGLTPGDTYYLYKNATANAYWTFDSTNLCLYVNAVQKVCYTQAGIQYLILEDSSFFLLEDGGKVILQ